jgi:LEA14-like dessication related protein
MRRPLLPGVILFSLVACSRPSPPTLVPKHASVSNISPTGIGFELTLAATNNNDIDLTAGNVQAHVMLDKRIEVGAATVEETVTLPAHQTTELKVASTVPWANVLPLAELVTSDRRWIPYSIDGSLSLGGDLVSVQVPFKIDGNVSHDQLMRATMNSIPGLPGSTEPDAAAPSDPGAPPPAAPPGRRFPPHTHR